MTSYAHTRYSCNPKYITEYLINNHPNEFEIIWCFRKGIKIPDLPQTVKTVRWRSLRYFYYIATSKFIISNVRLGEQELHLVKREGQKYIMTWHSSMGIKKVEKDGNLDSEYIKIAKSDSNLCDLILSGCKFRSDIIKHSFWYNGHILECGTPRNDMLFKDHYAIKASIYKKYNIPQENKILLYAPTFRDNYKMTYYKLIWDEIVSLLNKKYKEKFTILLRLHPTFLSNKHKSNLEDYRDQFIDVTDYEDMQELLSISDILITDYSSSIFDFALLKKPIFIYAADYKEYNRGTYLDLNQLPFPFAESESQLYDNIKDFDDNEYLSNLLTFTNNVLGNYENGNASEAFYKWMINQ